ncbi:cadherin EGF LAG seven-pass G-type receptor 2-like [Acanthaster planci]|uniref:Cadherin EGF LAG seven-pass G-type receptor 2-like n=1 Tax=Acanthaster planci TaxID=133434 RepID=A0A8B7Z8U4_ACAPL|nr:cadherin EGF LAG seven-pass G-type receptor 2-like [Acanthaster planci]
MDHRVHSTHYHCGHTKDTTLSHVLIPTNNHDMDLHMLALTLIQRATLILDDCNAAVALHHGEQLGNYSCAASVLQGGQLNGPCLSDKGAHCVSEWDGYRCLCPDGYGGRDCREDLSDVITFQGNGLLTFKDLTSPASIPWLNRVVFRTRDFNGVLMNIQLSSSLSIHIELESGEIQYRTPTVTAKLEGVEVNDGQWHDFTAEWKNNQIVLTLDFNQHTTSVAAQDTIDGQSVSTVYVGGLVTAEDTRHGFTGCTQGLKVGDNVLSLAIAKQRNIQLGCVQVDSCSFESVSCPAASTCVDLWGKYECICNQGHYGPECTSACNLNICQHGSTCRPSSASPYGYICECSGQYYGDHCQNEVEECDDDWWGYKICGPCECDEGRGFSSDCNKTTGECYCEENYYQPVNSDSCYPCNCYPDGSYGPECDHQTGQCYCKRDVMGRVCDSCADPYAEVTLQGCKVVYDSCPKRFAEGIWWPKTKFNQVALVDCPPNSFGKASRQCSLDDNWLEPDLFRCMSEAFHALTDMIADLQKVKRLNPDLSFSVVEKVHQATLETERMYGADVNFTYNVLVLVLNHESKQEGLNVTAAIRSSFTRKVVEIASRLLDPVNKAHWAIIQRSSKGVPEVISALEAFGANIAKTAVTAITSDYTHIPEIFIVAPNIVMHHDVIVREDRNSIVIPNYEIDQWEDGIERDTTRIHIPEGVIQPKPQVDDPSMISIESIVALASYIKYNTVGELLPNQSDSSVKPSEGAVGQVINTPVISLSLYDHLATEGSTDNLLYPIILEIATLGQANTINPQCVFWDFSLFDGVGGWSTKGCSVDSFNTTHINCSCNHLTNFAVMVDNAPPVVS